MDASCFAPTHVPSARRAKHRCASRPGQSVPRMSSTAKRSTMCGSCSERLEFAAPRQAAAQAPRRFPATTTPAAGDCAGIQKSRPETQNLPRHVPLGNSPRNRRPARRGPNATHIRQPSQTAADPTDNWLHYAVRPLTPVKGRVTWSWPAARAAQQAVRAMPGMGSECLPAKLPPRPR